jgi:hypothetical protein
VRPPVVRKQATLKVRRARALERYREAVERLYPGGE